MTDFFCVMEYALQ